MIFYSSVIEGLDKVYVKIYSTVKPNYVVIKDESGSFNVDCEHFDNGVMFSFVPRFKDVQVSFDNRILDFSFTRDYSTDSNVNVLDYDIDISDHVYSDGFSLSMSGFLLFNPSSVKISLQVEGFISTITPELKGWGSVSPFISSRGFYYDDFIGLGNNLLCDNVELDVAAVYNEERDRGLWKSLIGYSGSGLIVLSGIKPPDEIMQDNVYKNFIDESFYDKSYGIHF